MADFQGPNMSREWNLEIGQAMLDIIREEKAVKRVIIYELKNGKEEVFPIESEEHEQHERASAEREKSDPKSQVRDYRFETRVEND